MRDLCHHYEGPSDLWRLPRALLLISAQSKTPVGADPWIGAVRQALEAIREHGEALIVGDDPLPWALTLTLAAKLEIPFLAIGDRRRIIEDFNLDPALVGSLPMPAGDVLSRKECWRLRDDLAWDLADRVYPIALRKESRWHARLESHEKATDARFRVPQTEGRWDRTLTVPTEAVDEDEPTGWLTHWTRRSYRPWPGESLGEFCGAIVESDIAYPRSASAALARILEDRLIRPSTFRSTGGVPVVSFTAAPPSVIRQNFRWCPRRVAPMWEPYGIAIRTRLAEELGIVPVEYGGPPGWCTHSGGPFIGEEEWRCQGPLALNDLPPGSWMAILPTPAEACRFEESHSVPATDWVSWIEAGTFARHARTTHHAREVWV